MPTTDEILSKYGKKIESQLHSYNSEASSRDYARFKDDMVHVPSRYERWAKTLGNIVKINPSKKDYLTIKKQIDEAHLEVTVEEASTLSIMTLITGFLLVLVLSISIYLITGTVETPLTFFLLGTIASLFVFYYVYTMPRRLAVLWKLQASSQMVPAILYVVIYMKHTPNLERAVAFAAEHLEGPLALDFKKIFYDVEIGRFSTIKQSLDNYLERWKEYSPEFVESFHLIESSLFEPSDSRRVETLEKSLQVILDGIYEKMLKYSREIRSPLTNIYMLGIILPTLGLALLPLASTLLGDLFAWQHYLILFDILFPFFVFYMVSESLLKRPGGYGESSIIELNPLYSQFTDKKPWMTGFLIALPLLIIGLLPFIFQIPSFSGDAAVNFMGLPKDFTFNEIGISFLGDAKAFGFVETADGIKGPFGPLAIILSLFIPLAIMIFFSTSYYLKTRELIKEREKTQKLEEEFTNSLFILGNRLGDGVPAEIVFSKVAESTQGLTTQSFFLTVNQNIQQNGMSLETAIFDKKRGAIIFFPSNLIATAMRILVESAKKGLQVAARSLMSISEYLKNIQKINQRLRDLLAEIISDMKSNMTFLAPLLAGIVVGLGAMITSILIKLNEIQAIQGAEGSVSGFGGLTDFLDIFNYTSMVPPYYLQVIIGIYIVEIVFILTGALVVVESGKDPLKEKNELYKNLRTGISLYMGTALLSILALTILAGLALAGIAG